MRSINSDHLNDKRTAHNPMPIENGDETTSSTSAAAAVTIPPPIVKKQKTADEVWQEIVSGNPNRKHFKQEAREDDFDERNDNNEMLTLEDFLAKAEAIDSDDVHDEVKMPKSLMFSFNSDPLSPFQMNETGSGAARGRGAKRLGDVSGTLDDVSQQKQRRMIKNRESAARSRERKQAYQAELEALAVKLEDENQQLLRDKAQRTKDRYKLLMEKLVQSLKGKSLYVFYAEFNPCNGKEHFHQCKTGAKILTLADTLKERQMDENKGFAVSLWYI